jgi:hypothetical protein
MKFTGQGPAIFFVCLPFGILGFVLQIMFPGFTHIHFEHLLKLVYQALLELKYIALFFCSQ